ncbi:unnamed protein product [Lactuca virosa]|uniref:Uncharacterized protein n=1 Tax=Lactuca virosa TaxID=75947 RepID=A0AAU9N0K9_9ASTR|nr:unnamed protein product [Lactuca virosa]
MKRTINEGNIVASYVQYSAVRCLHHRRFVICRRGTSGEVGDFVTRIPAVVLHGRSSKEGRLQHPVYFVSPKCRQKRIKDYRLVLAGAATSRKTRLASFIYSLLYRDGEGEMDPPPAESS